MKQWEMIEKYLPDAPRFNRRAKALILKTWHKCQALKLFLLVHYRQSEGFNMKRIIARKAWDHSKEAVFLCLIERADGSKEALKRVSSPYYGEALIKNKLSAALVK